ncbi:YfiT family bacillithiol transferase [Terracidiphilus sp.]|jgi:uncharacterized damage-inducible protein DinB|uniref:YfiT family bacillithiol transferase n=1 Tax=Terracidiphilus sp. TaxID=1964191 RepID=UPI003C20E2D5
MTTPTPVLEGLRYPIGRFDAASVISTRAEQIETIRLFPLLLRAAVYDLSDAQLDTPYRDGGWSVRQLVHHIADSHANAYIRFKLALTEDNPIIKPYDEAAWAMLPDSSQSIDPSLTIVDGVHARMTALLEALPEAEFECTFQHPERGPMTIARNLATYDWHSRHHLAHITNLRQRMDW